MFKRLVLLLFVVVAVVVAYVWITMPEVSVLANRWPATTAFMEQRKAELRAEGKDDTLLYEPVPYTRISPYLRRAVLVAEDDTFFQHSAVDVKALGAAIRADWERKRLIYGGSTITLQLAKNLYLSPSRNPLRIIREYFIARSLEDHLTKQRILELYLNVVELGERVYGAQAGARYYFHVSASELTPRQAALLAGCLPNPRIMNPGRPDRWLRARQRMILARMRRWGYLIEQQVLVAKKPAAAPAAPTDTAPLNQTPLNDTATPAPTESTGTTETTGTTGTTATTGTTDTSATTDTTASRPPG